MARQPRIPQDVRRQVLTEAGYRCAVPTCRTILALDLHHILKVSEGGPNTADNLIALCPTCHALHHRKEIPQEAIRVWKGMLVTLNRAFDKDAMDMLLFLTLKEQEERPYGYTSECVMSCAGLINAGLVYTETFGDQEAPGGYLRSNSGADHLLRLTERGRMVVEAWRAGNVDALARALEQGAGPRDSNTE